MLCLFRGLLRRLLLHCSLALSHLVLLPQRLGYLVVSLAFHSRNRGRLFRRLRRIEERFERTSQHPAARQKAIRHIFSRVE